MALHLPIIDRCNIGCVFCSAWGRGGRFSLEYLEGEIAADRTGHVQVSGGDPFLRDPSELLRLLRFCKARGKLVEFQTNATLVTRLSPALLKAVVAMVDYFNVNHSAHTPELDLAVTLVEGGFAQRMAGLRELARLKAKVRLTYIVHTVNVRHCRAAVEQVARDLPRVSWLQFSYAKAMGKARNNADVVPRYEDAAPCLNDALRRAVELRVECVVDHIPVCFVPEFKDRHVDYLKMREGRPGIHLAEKQQVAACEGCRLRPWCPGPRTDYIDIHGSIDPAAAAAHAP